MKNRFLLTAGLFLFFLSLIYFSSFAKEGKPFINQAIKKQIQVCQTDSDCVKVRANCCSCSSGGSEIAVNKKYKQYWQEFLKYTCSKKKLACIKVYKCMNNLTPKCVSNSCVLEKGKDKKKWDNW